LADPAGGKFLAVRAYLADPAGGKFLAVRAYLKNLAGGDFFLRFFRPLTWPI
jgi:hypothetical protein